MTKAGTRSIHPGQYRLTRLQTTNWGTFPGYLDLAVDERGVLFTGPSGSGKSSLLDAHSVALLPSRDQGFNASADMTARGAKQSTRSTADYVRGAWAENDDEHGQSQVRYLRGGKPTWSAIAATYDNALGTVVTGVVIRWFTGTETDGAHLRALHQIHDGHFDLNLLEEWANRRFDVKWLKSAFPGPGTAYPPSESEYRRQLSKRVGLAGSKTAISLLGKAKAMKNVGDLNLFIRDNMLDVPETFASAQTMIGLFQPLNEAFETAQRAYLQEQVLHTIPSDWSAYCTAKDEASTARTVQGAAADAYLRGIKIELLDTEVTALEKSVITLKGQLDGDTSQATDAMNRYESLRDQFRAEGAGLNSLEKDRSAADEQRKARETAYGMFRAHVERLELTPPETPESFQALRGEFPGIAEGIRSRQDAGKPGRRQAIMDAGKAAERLREKTAELAALQSTGSLIPVAARDRREIIARGAKIDPSELPYAAELIDVSDGEEHWRPAAEKVLRSFGLRLLVPERFRDPVTTFIDEHDMRGIVEYSVVTSASAHQPRPDNGTLAAKLTVDTGHSSGRWLAGQVARQFTHVCVETAHELEHHPVAVTVLGTVKLRGNHYRKDDRPELTRASSYILGADTTAKLKALEEETGKLASASKTADAKANGLDNEWKELSLAADAAAALDAFTSWTDIDHWSSAKTIRDLDERIQDIRNNNVDLRKLERDCDEAKKKWTDLVRICEKKQERINDEDRLAKSLSFLRDAERRKPHHVDDDDRAYLQGIRDDIGAPDSPGSMDGFARQFTRELQIREQAASRNRDAAADRVNNAIEQFLEKWRDSAPDDSGDIDRSGADFAALHEEIARRRLPDAMERFRNMIAGDMLSSISILYRKIEEATADIKSKLDMVNTGLRRMEFNTDTHLQISAAVKHPQSRTEFRKLVDELHRRAPAARTRGEDALAQFNQIRDFMKRFTADDPESRYWRDTLLDVRLAYTFYGVEENSDGEKVVTYRNTAAGSGGEQEKLVAFCLAAALSYNLADRDSGGVPRFAPLMLDEAFSKSDETFASQALAAFAEFGFQLIMAAPIRMSGVLEPFIGQAVLVEKRVFPDGARSAAASATFGDLAIRRQSESDGVSDAAA
jgi:uncharacterized protein YPO0396